MPGLHWISYGKAKQYVYTKTISFKAQNKYISEV